MFSSLLQCQTSDLRHAMTCRGHCRRIGLRVVATGILAAFVGIAVAVRWNQTHPMLRGLSCGLAVSWGSIALWNGLILLNLVRMIYTGAADLRAQKEQDGHSVRTRPAFIRFFTAPTLQQLCEEYEAAVNREVRLQQRSREQEAERALLRERAEQQSVRRGKIAEKKRQRLDTNLREILAHPNIPLLQQTDGADLLTAQDTTLPVPVRRQALDRLRIALGRLTPVTFTSPAQIAFERLVREVEGYQQSGMDPEQWEQFSALVARARATKRVRIQHRLLEQAVQVARGELRLTVL